MSHPVPPTVPRSSRRPLPRRGLALAAALLTTLGLVTVTSPAAGAAVPVGEAAEFVQTAGGVRMTGWAIDPDALRSTVTMVATVDGKRVATFAANRYRADVGREHPASGANHGFDARVRVVAGRHTVCVRAVDLQSSATTALHCSTRTLDYTPRAALDPVRATRGHIAVSGWAVDPDSWRASIPAVVSLDGRAVTTTASVARSDLGKRLGPYPGTRHGFTVTFPASQGSHRVCATAKNISYGADTSLGCRTVTLDDRPFGGVEPLRQIGTGLALRGWAIDRDARTSSLTIRYRVDGGALHTLRANAARRDIAARFPGVGSAHGFATALVLPEGRHTVCLSIVNTGYGSDRVLGCPTGVATHTPTAAVTTLIPTSTGVIASGWATDPDTTQALPVRLYLDGVYRTSVTASGRGAAKPGHTFYTGLATGSGTHRVCAIALNRGVGVPNSPAACRSIALTLSPVGRLDTVTRTASGVRATGFAFDPDSASPASVTFTVDGAFAGTRSTGVARPDVVRYYPSAGGARGFAADLPAGDGKITVCATATNVGGGKDISLGCKLLIARNPVVPSAPRSVTATSGYNASRVAWTAPASDGGAPPSKYVVTVSPGGKKFTATKTAVFITGLKSNTVYRYSVQALNVAGASPAGVSPAVRTQAGPPPQQTPAPVSTSRYLRNVRSCSSAEALEMYRFGQADARRNPTGHRYLMLLDIGGQSQSYGGVILSATTRFVSYTNLLRCANKYVAGYASSMRPGAPATIAICVNNDIDVNYQTGRDWATKIVNPMSAYARQFNGLTIAGANDIEPGFRASYTATRSWLSGYLASTTARFVFNGSADGCAWTVTNRSCNNGWTMAGLQYLAGGAAPTRITNLPQIYNYTMADQWKYISLTGLERGLARINFGGPLTEVTACAQAGSCTSISGASAWRRLWGNLQSHPRLRVGSLPYSTDLRIDS